MRTTTFIVRTEKNLHLSIKRDALAQHKSVNELCIRRLALPSSFESIPDSIATEIQSIIGICGEHLIAIALFGSFARGEARDGSDVDLLCVLSQTFKINRALYGKWEAQKHDENLVEPSFVTLPTVESRVSGIWAEVAIEGLVLFDKGLQLQHYLNHVRQVIYSGDLVRSSSHGQNYWIHKERA